MRVFVVEFKLMGSRVRDEVLAAGKKRAVSLVEKSQYNRGATDVRVVEEYKTPRVLRRLSRYA